MILTASYITIYLTYFKIHPITGKVYYGRTSGKVKNMSRVNIFKVLRKRDKYHQKNKEGFKDADIDKLSLDKDAIRGREHQQIEKHKKENDAANIYSYIQAAICAFGDLVCYAILLNLYF